MRRHALCAALLSATVALGTVGAACIIADPPIDLPRPSPRRPTILRDQAVPPTTSVLGFFPDQFVVPVEADPSATLEWHLFIDYDPLRPPDLPDGEDQVAPSDGARRDVVATVNNRSVKVGSCHVIEVLVAACEGPDPQRGCGFEAVGQSGGHSFNAIGGDSIVWFYDPTGDPSGCPTLDAGLDGAFPDAASDAPLIVSDGGTE
jgi:hypothetical protein